MRTRKSIVACVLLVVATAGARAVWTVSGGSPRGGWVLVTHVVDGDTVHAGRGWRRTAVRFIGVDTPETVRSGTPVQPYGPEAAAFTRQALAGRWVRLETEPGDEIDVYGRLLAYAYLEDGTFFNRELVRLGYARAYTRFRFRYADEFRRLQAEARQARVGLWAGMGSAPALTGGKVIGNRRSRIYYLPGQKNYDRVAERNRVYFDSEEEAILAGYRCAKR